MATKIKVLHIIKSLGRGGAEMLLPETLKLHNQSQFEFHYIYFLPWKNQMVEAIEKGGGKITCLSASNNFQIIFKTRAAVHYIRKNNIQLIHCHLPWAGVVGRLIYRFIGLPVIYTEHNKQERYHFLTRWMNRLTFNWQSCAVAVSRDVSDSIHKNIKPKISVQEILNGVNTDYFQRDTEAGKKIIQEWKIPKDAFVVGTIAVFRFQKRLKEWLEVFSQVSMKYPNLYGIIVGDGPLKEDLIKTMESLGLKDRIVMPGLQTEVKPWLSAMDVFMMSSKFEGLPVALLEAMSMECAVVSTDAGGIKEVIRDEQDGLLVNVERWQDLMKCLERLIRDSDKTKLLSEKARERVVEAFGMNRMVKELEDLYNSYQ